MNDETLAEGRDKVLKEQIDDIFARACLNNEYFGIDGWYELHTPTLRKEIQELILQDRERAVKELAESFHNRIFNNFSMLPRIQSTYTGNRNIDARELQKVMCDFQRDLAELSNPTQEKEGEVKLQPISLEDAIKAMGYSFRDLSYHSDGRWIARSGANTGRFMTSARTPRQAVFKLAEKIEQERRAKEKEKKSK